MRSVPENILGFMSGLLTGSGSLFTGRWMVVGKSPLTGGWGDANCGGTFAFAIKQTGYDGILFKGISPTPVYLLIDSHGPKLLDASHLWGKDTVETEAAIQAAHSGKKQPAVACIGQAGENLSLISGIVNDKGRIAARSGLGAVMGSKRLKAVALAGAKRVGATPSGANETPLQQVQPGYPATPEYHQLQNDRPLWRVGRRSAGRNDPIRLPVWAASWPSGAPSAPCPPRLAWAIPLSRTGLAPTGICRKCTMPSTRMT